MKKETVISIQFQLRLFLQGRIILILSMASSFRIRNNSTLSLTSTSLSILRQAKKARAARNSTDKLIHLRSTYEQPFLSRRPESTPPEAGEEEPVKGTYDRVHEDFESRCRKICGETCFQLQVFGKIFSQNHRKKGILLRFYGWDREFEEILFLKQKEELRPDLTPETLYSKLGFGSENLASRNSLNKLRLFLNELITFSKRQQELQSKFMKIRLSNQFGKLDRDIKEMAREKKHIRGYIQDIVSTHEMMLNSKMQTRNQVESLARIERDTGTIKINEFYQRQEDTISGVEQFMTALRLGRGQ